MPVDVTLGTPPRDGISVERALGSETRAAIYAHLRNCDEPQAVREIAAAFGLHPNVARTHLQLLADAGLASVGRRKHPGGGRPARVYSADPDAPDPMSAEPGAAAARAARADYTLIVRLLAGLLDAAPSDSPARIGAPPGPVRSRLPARAYEAAHAEGRRLSAARHRVEAPAGESPADLVGAVQDAVLALRPWVPGVRIVRTNGVPDSGAGTPSRASVDVTGLRDLVAPLGGARPELADAIERGLLSGAVAGAGVPVSLVEVGSLAGEGPVWRARAVGGAPRSTLEAAATVDTRQLTRERGVLAALRAMTRLRGGELLEVLAEGPGSPAAYARWADRAGHQLLAVERATDATGRAAIRLLLRKGT